MRKYKSGIFQTMYDQFYEMFKKEGDCYDSIWDSIENDYKHSMLPDNNQGPPKHLVKGVLQDVAVDFYKNKIKVISEEEYFGK